MLSRLSPTDQGRYIPALDGLRALAVLGVLAFHDNRLSGGFFGVDLFFVLSGYLITGVLVSRHRTTFGHFWAQRVRRLIPSVLVLIVVVLIVYRVAGDPSDWIPARRDAPWAQFYGANWHQIWLGTDYWDRFASPSPFEHLWSLAIEEQFYLVWPVIILGLLRVVRPALVTGTMALLAVASGALMWGLSYDSSVNRVYMGTDTRSMSLILGAFLAMPALQRFAGACAIRWRRTVSLVCLVFITVLGVMWSCAAGDDQWLFRGEMHANAALSGLVILGVTYSEGAVAWILSRRPLVAIGKLSYALYLWHWPVFIFLSERRTGIGGWTLTGLRLGATVALSVTSYLVIEKPIRFNMEWMSGKRGFLVFMAAMAGTTLVWLAISVPKTTNAVTKEALSEAISVPQTSSPPPVREVRPVWTDLGVQSVMYLGDSIASDMAPAIEAGFSASGVEFISGAFGGAGIVGTRDNREPLSTLRDRIDRDTPDLLILQLSVWDAEQPADLQLDALTALAEMSREHNMPVVLVSFPPLPSERVRPGQSLMELKARDIAMSSEGRIAYLDQRRALGSEFSMDIDRDRIPERKTDGIHVCPTGALIVARWLLIQIEALVPSFTATEDLSWTTGDWTLDPRYDNPPGACARR